jgi:hypothetical protein
MATAQVQKDRVYELTIGDTKTGNAFVINSSLQVRFDISKSSDNKRKGNSATIEVYNLSPEHIKILDATEYAYCKFSAGYKYADGPLVIVEGNVVEVITVKKGTDYVTQIKMGEGYSDLNHSKIKSLVGPGKRVEDAVDEILKNMPGVARGAFTGTNLNNPILYGYPLNGTPMEQLSQLGEANRIEWQVSGGVLNISDENGPLSKNQVLAPIVSEATGLIEVPFVTSAEGRKLPKDKKRRRGVQFKALLNARYAPGFMVKIESQRINGFFRINTARLTGDFRGGDWYVECFCADLTPEDLVK